jgi:phosphinothricin acetyltransferase
MSASPAAPTATGIAVVPMTADHWQAVGRIYRSGIATRHATFESEPPTWQAFDASKLRGQRLHIPGGAG